MEEIRGDRLMKERERRSDEAEMIIERDKIE